MYSWQDTNSHDDIKKAKNSDFLSNIVKNYLLHTNQQTPFHKVIHYVDIDRWWNNKYTDTVQVIQQNFDALVVISMGGAALNPQTVIDLCAHKRNHLPIYFLNNTDPYFFKSLIGKLNLSKTAFLTISNSGETLETIALIGAVINEFETSKINNYEQNLFFILGKSDNTLRLLADRIKSVVFDHETEISGRFAGLTNVTCLIGMIGGLDMYSYLTGASEVIQNFRELKQNSLPAKAALSTLNCSYSTIVNLAYLQNFSAFLEWYCQIIAESLGKNGGGFTPLRGLGPNDQHSMMQLYLEGPKDKLFNLFYVKNLPNSCINKISTQGALASLKNKILTDVNNASFNSVAQTFKDCNIPFRTIILDNLDEKSVGALMAHSMIEIILLGYMLEINPFDQPGVETVKKHVNKILSSY